MTWIDRIRKQRKEKDNGFGQADEDHRGGGTGEGSGTAGGAGTGGDTQGTSSGLSGFSFTYLPPPAPVHFSIPQLSSSPFTASPITRQAVASAMLAAYGLPSWDLPEEKADAPIRAWKHARLGVTPDNRGVAVYPMHWPYPHTAEADAICLIWANRVAKIACDHEPPAMGCGCGFYALNTEAHPNGYGEGDVGLDVELYGRVVVYEKGYRASKQRILSVTLSNVCSQFLCTDRAIKVAFPPNGYLETMGQINMLNPHSYDRPTRFARPVCGAHAAEADKEWLVGLADVANALQTEVRWGDPA